MEYAIVAVPAIAMMFGAMTIGAGWKSIRQSRTLKSWPTTVGTVLSSHVTQEKKRDKNGSMSTEYRRSIEYEYSVRESTFRSRRIGKGSEPAYYLKDSCERALTLYPEGGAVTVHYDPNDPSDAVLDVTRYDWIGYFLVGGLLFLVGGWFVGMYLISRFESHG